MTRNETIFESYRERLTAILGKDYLFRENSSSMGVNGKYPCVSLVLYSAPPKPGNSHLVSYFSVYQMQGCCGIAISTDAYVNDRWRHKGLGTLLNSLRIDLARCCGYGVLLCTDLTANTAQRRILEKNGWKDIYTFVNPRTQNQLAISVINLTKQATL